MTYLVLGASSFYGSNFCALLKSKGEDVIELSRPEWELGDDIPYADVVVNFASHSLVAQSWERPDEWMLVNAVRTTTLLDQVRALKIPRFIHVSTPEVYGHNVGPVREGHPFNPSTPYAVSRAAADMMIEAYVKAYDFPAIITRTANIYGLGQPEHRFIPHAFRTLREGKKLGLDGGGKTIRGWLHVKDAAEATRKIASHGKAGETYHIAPQGVLSVSALARLICHQIGKDPNEWLYDTPERLGKDDAYILESSKLRKLGWSDKITIKEGLAEYGNHGSIC